MPRSVIRKQSFGSVKVFWLDRSLLKSRIRQAARNLSRQHEEVVQVVLFGSVASGRAVPSSDADILVVVRDSETPLLDRAALYRDLLQRHRSRESTSSCTPEKEISDGSIPVAAAALRTGIELYRAA